MNSHFTDRVEKRLGPPEDSIALSEEQYEYAQAHLPPSLVQFLRQYGFGSYFKKGVQFVDPQSFRSLIALIFKADSDFNRNDCHAVFFTAFGKIRVWSEVHKVVDIDLLQNQVWCDRLFPTEFDPSSMPEPAREMTDDAMSIGLLPRRDSICELYDIHQEPMFARSVEAQGPLQRDECVGFVPSLGLVGFESNYRVVENVRRVQALEHFAIIAQMQPFRLTRMGKCGYEYLREIG